jgi:3-isopropylmalate dehydrogenase
MKTLLLLPGDGIGPEVIGEVERVIDWLRSNAGLELTTERRLAGGAGIDAEGTPLSEETLAAALAADAVLLGAVGGPRWEKVERHLRPEMAILGLRGGMKTFANLRPIYCFDALADASTLKREVVAGLDIMIVRELTGGVYFGQPKTIETLPDGSRRGIDTQVYTTDEIERVARVAFELARGRQNRVCSAEKSNVMDTGLLWREVVTALHAREYPDVALSHMLADNMAMQLVYRPKQFDVIVTDNLFGDILSDEAAMCTGSLGMLPSASLGEGGPGLYEPIHGTAPDIAGKSWANPLAAILSFAMALRSSLRRADLADLIVAAVSSTLDGGARTRDIGGTLGTAEMGDAVIAHLQSGLS